MEYELNIWCEECTKMKRAKKGNEYMIEKFYSLTSAIQHINQYGHKVKIDLEPRYEEE